jgi:hypothetical protein
MYRISSIQKIIIISTVFCIVASGLLLVGAQEKPRILNDQGPIAQQVYANKTRLEDQEQHLETLDNRVNDIRDKQENTLQKLAELDVTVAAHERVLWVVIGALISLILEMGIRLWGRQQKRSSN